MIGACIPLFVTLLAWRLALLISPRKRPLEDRVLAQEEMVYPLKPTSNLQHLAAGNNQRYASVCTRDLMDVLYLSRQSQSHNKRHVVRP